MIVFWSKTAPTTHGISRVLCKGKTYCFHWYANKYPDKAAGATHPLDMDNGDLQVLHTLAEICYRMKEGP